MLAVVDELVWSLRRDGFTVSVAQAIDVARVVALVGFGNKGTLCEALSAIVVTRREEMDRFRRAFDGFFLPGRHRGDLFDRLREQGIDEAEIALVRELLEQLAGGLGGLSGHGSADVDLTALLLSAGMVQTLKGLHNPLQLGFFAERAANKAGIRRAAEVLRALRSVLRDAFGMDRADTVMVALEAELDQARRIVRAHVESVLEGRDERETTSGQIDDLPWEQLVTTDPEELRRTVRRFVERLRRVLRMRERRDRRGRIDVRRMARRALATSGVPFWVVRRKRRRELPRLYVLCDVSASVRTASFFLLELVHALQGRLSSARSFVFVSDLVETTSFFAEHSAVEATARILGGEAVSLSANSNYGRAFRAFEASVGSTLDRRATLVILGDGRTNYLASGEDVLQRLMRHAGAIVWICPEPMSSWGQGDSAMPRFSSVVSKAVSARTIRELEAATRKLLRRPVYPRP